MASFSSSPAMVTAIERHLWLNLSVLKEKERVFLFDGPVSPTDVFGTAVETVVQKFKEAKVKSQTPSGDRVRRRLLLHALRLQEIGT